jgi:hypothetical protein
MTEAEWQDCVNVEPMLRELHKSFGGDKLRLFGCVVYRRVWGYLDDNLHNLLDATEEWTISAIGLDQWLVAWERYSNQLHASEVPYDAQLIRRLVISSYSNVLSPVWQAAVRSRQYALSRTSVSLQKELTKAEKKWQAIALRDLFGNPFRPVSVDPSWLTSDVVALATGIYEERAFDRMPILADALMDASCDNDDVLNHCRQPVEHVRGCWVVDLILGKR